MRQIVAGNALVLDTLHVPVRKLLGVFDKLGMKLKNPETKEQLVQRLAAQGVVVVKHLDAAGAAYIRLSFHCYNVTAEIDRFIETFSESAP